MTPKEKAKELVDKMEKDFQYFASRQIAIQHALIAVDEIIFALNDDIYIQGETDIDSHREYWQEVEQEILAL